MLALKRPPEIEERLDAVALRTGRRKSDHALEAILDHLDDIEDVQIAEQRLYDLRAGRSETIALSTS